jgi:hypothetical protein
MSQGEATSVMEEYAEIKTQMAVEADHIRDLTIKASTTLALKQIIEKYLSHLPKVMFGTGEYCLLVQIADNLLFDPDIKGLEEYSCFCKIHPEFLPVGFDLPIPVLDIIDINAGSPEVAKILTFINDHKDSEEEIHLAKNDGEKKWYLLRYQGIWAAGGQEDDNWTDHEILSNSDINDILETMERKLAFGRETVLQNIRIFDGQVWHDVVFVNPEGYSSNEYYKGSAGTFKLI